MVSVNHNNQKKIAVINDFTGFGRCSIAVELPIISKLKVQCCPLPTAILSNHTGFESFYFEDFTNRMKTYMDEWAKLDLKFSGICTGFLGSFLQIKVVEEFLQRHKTADNVVVIDPVMGDYGKLYPTYTKKACEEMKKLARYADIMTPNLTEASILTDTPYNPDSTDSELETIAAKLAEMGPQKVVITGIARGDRIHNFCLEQGKPAYAVSNEIIGNPRSGTGDIFSAIIAADAVNGIPFKSSVEKASSFIKLCIQRAMDMNIPLTDGVPFEEVLYQLS